MSVIVPARNEEACLALCLESLLGQEGIDFEVIVLDDASTDRTAEIARTFVKRVSMSPGEDAWGPTNNGAAGVLARPHVIVISAPPLPENWTGKNNAMSAGARIAKGKWLLFTDADTVHKSGSLARAVAEAEEQGAALLSYSPEQEVRTFWEKAVMPVIFAELAATYPPKKVNDPGSPIAAANGQYLMISREAYDAVGGHTKIAGDLLEDVAIARLVKSSGRKIFFRYGGHAVRTRMYRSWAQMKEGWTKNLALLFHPASSVACLRLAEAGFIAVTLAQSAFLLLIRTVGFRGFATMPLGACLMPALLATFAWSIVLIRLRKAHFPVSSNLLSIFGLPVFAHLLLQSAKLQRLGDIDWRGRQYKSTKKPAPRWFVTQGGLFLIAVLLCVLLFGAMIVAVSLTPHLRRPSKFETIGRYQRTHYAARNPFCPDTLIGDALPHPQS